jgi:hypothetical protein
LAKLPHETIAPHPRDVLLQAFRNCNQG